MLWCRYANALEKANYASLALKAAQEAEKNDDMDVEAIDDEGAELAAMLERTRRVAQAREREAAEKLLSVDAIAEEAAKRRAAEEAQRAAEGLEGMYNFCRSDKRCCASLHIRIITMCNGLGCICRSWFYYLNEYEVCKSGNFTHLITLFAQAVLCVLLLFSACMVLIECKCC